MSKIDEKQYIDKDILSKNLDKVIINESKILKKNLKMREDSNSNIIANYV